MLRVILLIVFLIPRFVFSNITWDEIEQFFDFSIEQETTLQENLKNNIQKLVEQQLVCNSGQNLWEAFLYWHETCKSKFTFKFKFEVNDNFGANIFLKNYDATQKIFHFIITCNKSILKSNLNISNENMIYRPCLIKLNEEYHLREQELPFFITLAHEFLHALNQLERIQYAIEQLFKSKDELKDDILTDIEERLPIQAFLKQKLNISQDNFCLKEEYIKLWQNYNLDDSLDEMTVILKSDRKTKNKITSIGETTFLQEFYNDPTIVSWAHNSAHDINL